MSPHIELVALPEPPHPYPEFNSNFSIDFYSSLIILVVDLQLRKLIINEKVRARSYLALL